MGRQNFNLLSVPMNVVINVWGHISILAEVLVIQNILSSP